MKDSVQILAELGYKLYASKGTAEYYRREKIKDVIFYR